MVGVVLWLTSTRGVMGASFEFHHVRVLGTELHLILDAPGQEEAERAEQLALQEIDRLDRVLSSYDPESELSRWNRSGVPSAVSAELAEVLTLSEQWFARSGGAFQPGVELASRIWREAEQQQQLPDDEALALCAKQLSQLGWHWEVGHSQVAADPRLPLTFNAMAKGWIIDAVVNMLTKHTNLTGGSVAIGGDLRVFGAHARWIGIRPPTNDLATDRLPTVSIRDAAVATSSGAFRGVTIEQQRYSHLIDPRTARPVSHVRSVTVIAPRAADADALATIASVLTVDESVSLVDSIPGASCLILDVDGHSHASQRWPSTRSPVTRLIAEAEKTPIWNGGMELAVDFEIFQAKKSGRYRRPYVAVWVEDHEGYPVRTILLWVQKLWAGASMDSRFETLV